MWDLPARYLDARAQLAQLEHYHLGGEALLQAAFSAIEPPQGRCLELAAGVGGVGRYLLSMHSQVSSVEGLDLDADLVALNNQLNHHFDLDYRCHVRDVLGPIDPSHDWVLVSHLLPFLANPQAALTHWFSSRAPGGYVFIEPVRQGVMDYPQVWADAPEQDRLLTEEALLAHIEQAGGLIVERIDLTRTVAAELADPQPGQGPRLVDHIKRGQMVDRIRNARRAVLDGALGIVGLRVTVG